MIGSLILLIVLFLLDGISIKRQELTNFVSVIQLVTALNFANISTSLHEKMFSKLVDVPTYFNLKFGKLQKSMVADIESLKAMSPIQTKDNKTNQSKIDNLTNEYQNLMTRWDAEKKRLESKMKEFLSTKGMNSLFLFVSLYCIVDMFFIAYEFFRPTSLDLEYCFGLFTLSSTLFAIGYFVFILLGRTNSFTKEKLYLKVSCWFMICLGLSYFAYDINIFISQRVTLFEEEHFLNVSDTMAIFLPFLGFCLCLIFIIAIWGQVAYMSWTSISDMAKTLSNLHKQKLDLDKTYDSFLPMDEMQFR